MLWSVYLQCTWCISIILDTATITKELILAFTQNLLSETSAQMMLSATTLWSLFLISSWISSAQQEKYKR